jgi:transposase InsO family protein
MFPTGNGNGVRVEDRRGQRQYWLSMHELLVSGEVSVIAPDSGPRSDDDIEIASVVLDNLDEQQLRIVGERAAHVREITTGYRSGSAEMAEPGEPRPQYRSDVPLEARYKAKAAEVGRDKRTIERWVAAYRDHGEAGLTTASQRNPDGSADSRWIATASEIMIDHADQSRPNRKSIFRQTEARLALKYGPGVVPIPARATCYRLIKKLNKRIPTFDGGSRRRNRDVIAQEERVFGTLVPTRPGEYVVMDTNCLDVFALDPITLKWVTVEATVAMDVYTRCIVGIRLAPTTKSLEVAATLFQTFRPNPAPADWPTEAVWPEHGIPRAVFPDVDGLQGNNGTCNPSIYPDTIVIDHGRQYKSSHITSVCQRMGISIQPARLRTATDKGMLERFFLTLRLGLLQELPGYKGPDVYSRGLAPESEAFYYIDELEALIRKWIAVVYHNEPHRSLFDPDLDSYLLTPAQMFEHGIAKAGYIEAPRDPDLAFEFLQPIRRRINREGVRFKGRIYNGPALEGLRGLDSGYRGKANGKWFFHVNPDDVLRIYFRNPDTRKWCTLMWKHAPFTDLPMSEDAVKLARKWAMARGGSTKPEDALAALLDERNVELGRTVAERRVALRLSRERATLLGDLSTDDADAAKAFLLQERQERALAMTQPNAVSEQVDDLDALENADVYDEEDEDLDDDEYYAEAFEDV